MIILTPEQADQVRGLTAPGHAIAPRPLANGNFALPEACINDPAHAVHSTFLKTLPTVPDNSIREGTRSDPFDPNAPIMDSDWSLDADLNAASSYDQSWPVAASVVVDVLTDAVLIQIE